MNKLSIHFKERDVGTIFLVSEYLPKIIIQIEFIFVAFNYQFFKDQNWQKKEKVTPYLYVCVCYFHI